MLLDGELDVALPAAQVRAELHDPAVLKAMLPGEAEVAPAGPGAFDFTLRRSLGFLELKLNGQILLEDLGPDAVRVTMKAAHMIGGTVDLAAVMRLSGAAPDTRIAYDGTLEATGLAGRVLRDRAMQVRPFVARAFGRLKARIEQEGATGA